MLYHCGLLSERPDRDATLQWVRRGGWDLPGHPPEIEFERRVWLAMPGFSTSFHVHTLRTYSHGAMKRFVGQDYDELKDAVAENWLSCTRDDAAKLSRMRPGTGDIPVISQLSMLDDLKQGYKPTQIAKDYRVHPASVVLLRKRGVRTGRSFLPEGFELIRL